MSTPESTPPQSTTIANSVSVFRRARNVTFEGGSISAHTVLYEFDGDNQTPVENISVPQGEITTFEDASDILVKKGVRMDHGQLKVVQKRTSAAIIGMQVVARQTVKTRMVEDNLVLEENTTPVLRITSAEALSADQTWTEAEPVKIKSRTLRAILSSLARRLAQD